MSSPPVRTLTADEEKLALLLTKQVHENGADAVLHLFGSAGHRMVAQPFELVAGGHGNGLLDNSAAFNVLGRVGEHETKPHRIIENGPHGV